MAGELKQCSKCLEFRSLSEFGKRSRNKSGLREHCKSCGRTISKNRIRKPTKYIRGTPYNRKSYYKSEYGITLEQYNKMALDQNNVCAICGNPETMKHQNGKIRNLAVDHCHLTGKVRGLLCSAHNRGIGYFGDNIELLKKAIKYLETKKYP